ncbi:hypothetical protein NDU88_004662, partial [Pleurodeles waltl]
GNFYLLTDVTTKDILLSLFVETWPPIVGLQDLNCSRHTSMGRCHPLMRCFN